MNADSNNPASENCETLTLIVPGRLPSLNTLLGMNPFELTKLKRKIQRDMLCAIQACESDSSTTITRFQNSTRTPSATLAFWIRTHQIAAKSKPRNAGAGRANKNTPK